MIIDMTGSESRIIYLPLPVDDPRRRRPDIARARTQLQWTPKVVLNTGLTRTISWFQAQIQTGELEAGLAERLFQVTSTCRAAAPHNARISA